MLKLEYNPITHRIMDAYSGAVIAYLTNKVSADQAREIVDAANLSTEAEEILFSAS